MSATEILIKIMVVAITLLGCGLGAWCMHRKDERELRVLKVAANRAVERQHAERLQRDRQVKVRVIRLVKGKSRVADARL